jgi:transposase-like protein
MRLLVGREPSSQLSTGPKIAQQVSTARPIIKRRGHFPSDEVATRLIWLALRNITADWKRASKE